MVNILLISNLYPSQKSPYKGSFVKNIFQFFSDSKYIGDIEKVVLKNEGVKAFNYLLFYKNIFTSLIFKKHDYIYVHYVSHSILPCLLVNFFNKNLKIIINFHGSDLISEESEKIHFKNLKSYLCKKAINVSRKIIVPSVYYKSILLEYYDIKEEMIFVSPSGGVNLDTFSPNKDKIKKYDFGYVGRLEKDKGIFTFLDAIALASIEKKDLKVLICGSGNQKDNVVEYINKYCLGNVVTLISGVDQRKLPNIYNEIKFFVFPTQRTSESLGLVGIEAMACGCPVIASNAYGPQTYVTNSNGYLFKPGDTNALLRELLNSINLDDVEYFKKSNNAIFTASEYDSNVVLNNLVTSIFLKVGKL